MCIDISGVGQNVKVKRLATNSPQECDTADSHIQHTIKSHQTIIMLTTDLKTEAQICELRILLQYCI